MWAAGVGSVNGFGGREEGVGGGWVGGGGRVGEGGVGVAGGSGGGWWMMVSEA